MSVTLLHSVKAVGRNEMPFCREYIHVAPRTTGVRQGTLSSTERGIWRSEFVVKICIANCYQTVKDTVKMEIRATSNPTVQTIISDCINTTLILFSAE